MYINSRLAMVGHPDAPGLMVEVATDAVDAPPGSDFHTTVAARSSRLASPDPTVIRRPVARGGWQVARWANAERRGDGCPRGRPTSPVAGDGLLALVCRTAELVRRRLEEEVLAEEGLTWAGFAVLDVVTAGGWVDWAGVVAGTGLDRRAVSGAVAVLTAAGYVELVAPGRGRTGRLRASPSGHLVAAYLWQRIDAVQAQLIRTGGAGCLLRRIASRLQPPLPVRTGQDAT